jgi:hypothetical protein
MEFRWLTSEEQRARIVESRSLSDVLALAQKLQAESDGQVSDEQVVALGQELGIRPEHVREALRLRRRAPQPTPVPRTETTTQMPNAVAAAGQTLTTVCALLLLPLAMNIFGLSPVWMLFALLAAAATGWAVNARRLAGVAGAVAVPAVLLISFFYAMVGGPGYWPGVGGLLISLLALCPLGFNVARGAAALRRWAERLVRREHVAIAEH